MALRNYLYAKHLDPRQAALINKDNKLTNRSESTRDSCPPERELVLEDGSRVCANCPDCPKKFSSQVDKPLVEVVVEKEVCFN